MTPEEALAAAICNGEAARAPGSPGWEYFSEEARDLFRREASPLLPAITALGFSLVPTADLDRLRAVERAARELWVVLDDTYPETEVHGTPGQAMAELRAALGDRAAEPTADLDRLRAERDALAEDEQSAQEDLDRLRAALAWFVENAPISWDEDYQGCRYCEAFERPPKDHRPGCEYVKACAALGDRAAEEGRDGG